ncbi:MAG: 30S ribosomal protein S6 [Bryobacterales bacterium]|nr:30S ribosomal protein S6 [Bryobacterales bacterium]MDE0296892.1 30S ribosomal protein S6 [Bryobacterales bacterium]MDE0434490.1 30S ribosomal protein S6 [Bryobacterales bacterium]
MRIYELIYILKPNLADEETEASIAQFTKAIEEGGGTIDKIDRWGKRRLAYEVQHQTEGYYVLVQYSLKQDHGLSKEIERRLGVADAVIKYMTVRIDEDLQRIAKLKKKREMRAANRPPAAAEARPKPRPAATTPGAPEAPASAPGSPGEASS